MFECRNPTDARTRAEKIFDGKQYAGVDVFKMEADENLGEYGEPEFFCSAWRCAKSGSLGPKAKKSRQR